MFGLSDSNLSEVQFTSKIANKKELVEQMIEAAGLSNAVDFDEITDQDRSTDKRPDIVLRNNNGEITCVIEAQDQNGTLDFYHAAKLPLYMHRMDCEYGIMIADEVPEDFRSYLVKCAAMGHKISIVCPIIIDNNIKGFNCLYKAEKSALKAADNVKNTSSGKAREIFLSALDGLEDDKEIPEYCQTKHYTYLKKSNVGNMLCIHYAVNALTISTPIDRIKGDPKETLSDYDYYNGQHDGLPAIKIKVTYDEYDDISLAAKKALTILSELNDKVENQK